MTQTVDAEPNGGTSSNIAGVGDVTTVTFDGFDRRKMVVDPLGNKTSFFYDPDDNVVRVIQDGDPEEDIAGGFQNKTLAVTESIHDSLSRVVATHRVLFQTPDAVPTRVPVLTDTPSMDDLAPYLADASNDSADVPGTIGISVIGRVTSLTEYDRESRVTFTVQDDLDAYRSDYDGADRVIRTEDSAIANGFSGGSFSPGSLDGNEVCTDYDDSNNVIERLETDVTEISGVPAELFRTTFVYDSLDRLQTVVDNIGQAEDYRYDSRSNLVCKADAVGSLGGRSIARRGCGSSEAVSINSFGNVTRTRFDGINRTLETEAILTATGEGDGTIGCTLEGQPAPGPAPDPSQSCDGLISVYYAFDDNSQLLALRDDDGNTTGYIYDNQNRTLCEIKGLGDPAYTGTTFPPIFCPTLNLTGDSGAFNVSLRNPTVCDPPIDTEAAGTDINFTFDRDSNIIQTVDEAGNAFGCTFDALNWLVVAAGGRIWLKRECLRDKYVRRSERVTL